MCHYQVAVSITILYNSSWDKDENNVYFDKKQSHIDLKEFRGNNLLILT